MTHTTSIDLDVTALLRGAVEAWQMGSPPPITLHEVSPGRVWQVRLFGTHVGTIDRIARKRFSAYGRTQHTRTRVRRSLDAAVLALVTGPAR